MAQVVWTLEALADLESTMDYIGRDSTVYANALSVRAFELTDHLENFPELGRVMPEFANDRIRDLILQNYRIVYHITVREIRIIAFIHGARDLGRITETRGWPPE